MVIIDSGLAHLACPDRRTSLDAGPHRAPAVKPISEENLRAKDGRTPALYRAISVSRGPGRATSSNTWLGSRREVSGPVRRDGAHPSS